MRVLVLGATGAIGGPLVPLLTAAGHHVIACGARRRPTTSDPAVTGEVVDLLDATSVRRALHDHRPDAVVHLATAIPPALDPRRIGEQFAVTDRLRTQGTRHLLDAASAAGDPLLITQGLAFAYEPGDAVRREDAPLWPSPPRVYADTVAALAEMERLTSRAGGVVLRFGHLYGPGTAYAPDGSTTNSIRSRRMPIVGRGSALFSFTHVEDAASGVLAALDHPGAGAVNVVDDEPLRVREWLPWFADVLGAPTPRRVPAWVARFAVGPFGVAYLNELAGASNARARQVLQWRPRYPSFRDGVLDGLRDERSPAST